jgi:hypothetical protein
MQPLYFCTHASKAALPFTMNYSLKIFSKDMATARFLLQQDEGSGDSVETKQTSSLTINGGIKSNVFEEFKSFEKSRYVECYVTDVSESTVSP